MRRAVVRGLQRREDRIIRRIGIGEKSVKKRRVYFTIVSDLERSEVIWIGRGCKRETLDAFWTGLSLAQRETTEGVTMDIHEPYIRSTLAHPPGAADKIVFDKFHISMYLTGAVDLTRRIVMRERGDQTTGRKTASEFFEHWFEEAAASVNAPMVEAAKTLRRHLANIITYVTMPITNAAAESMNSRIQLIKFRSRGFRNPARFEGAIMFHCGGLEMDPAT